MKETLKSLSHQWELKVEYAWLWKWFNWPLGTSQWPSLATWKIPFINRQDPITLIDIKSHRNFLKLSEPIGDASRNRRGSTSRINVALFAYENTIISLILMEARPTTFAMKASSITLKGWNRNIHADKTFFIIETGSAQKNSIPIGWMWSWIKKTVLIAFAISTMIQLTEYHHPTGCMVGLLRYNQGTYKKFQNLFTKNKGTRGKKKS